MENSIEFCVEAKYALFTDPVTRIGGEKSTYQVPTYEALKGITSSIYWKPTLIWVIDSVRVMNKIRTESKNVKPLKYNGGNDLSIYTYLRDIKYQVKAHFEWNMKRTDLEQDRNEDKHYQIAQRMLKKGGRRDIFLGARECQGYVEPCVFGGGSGYYDNAEDIAFGLMFHSFSYPEESGVNELHSRFWYPSLKQGVIAFPRPEECSITKYIHAFQPTEWAPGKNFSGLKEEGLCS